MQQQRQRPSCDEVRELGKEILALYRDHMAQQGIGDSELEEVLMFLMSRVLEFLRAAIVLLDSGVYTPVAIGVLARHLSESAANLSFILKHDSKADRQQWAKRFIDFGDYRKAKLVRENEEVYLARCDEVRRREYERQVKVYDRVKADAKEAKVKAKNQSEKRVPAFDRHWNGQPISETLAACYGEEIRKWWPLMCDIAHGNFSMKHKSLTVQKGLVALHQPDYGEGDSVYWVFLMSRAAFVAALQHLSRESRFELDNNGLALKERLQFAEAEES